MNVLSIAGFDPSGGAGVLADLSTFTAHGAHGCAVITAITAQNARTVDRVAPVDADLVRAQLDTLVAGVPIAATKIGMLGSAAVARTVADAVRVHGLPQVVVDPVLRASAGPSLLEPAALDVLRRELFARATLITPNAEEAAVLLDRPVPATVRELRDAAFGLRESGAPWVLVKGGHVDSGDECVDVLCGDREVHELRVRRINGAELHGTGCMLSSAIASRLALGAPMIDACAAAQRYVAARLAEADQLVEMLS